MITAHAEPAPAPTITDRLLAALNERIASGVTVYRIARDAGLDPGLVSRFRSGERDLRSSSIDRLAKALGLDLVSTSPTLEGADRR